MRAALSWGFVGGVLVACHATPDPPPPQPVPLAQCATGWWIGASNACKSYCGTPPAPPECAQSDCVAKAIMGYMPAGQLVSAVITYSATGATLSSIGQPAIQSYEVVGDTGIKTTPPGKIMPADCKTTGLSISYAAYVRPPPGVSKALDQAQASGMPRWTGVPVPK